jgi:hypothetical protein
MIDIQLKRKVSAFFAGVNILANVFNFLPVTIQIIVSGGGSWGFGLVALPITFVTHLFLIPSFNTLRNWNKDQKVLFVFNFIGFIWTIFWCYLFLFESQ